MNIKEWISSGNTDSYPNHEIDTTGELLELAGHALDSACTSDILGEDRPARRRGSRDSSTEGRGL